MYPPFWFDPNKDLLIGNLLSSQFKPVKGSGHEQLNVEPMLVQVPPFSHGPRPHGAMTRERNKTWMTYLVLYTSQTDKASPNRKISTIVWGDVRLLLDLRHCNISVIVFLKVVLSLFPILLESFSDILEFDRFSSVNFRSRTRTGI